MQTINIFGGTGFIGLNLINYLLKTKKYKIKLFTRSKKHNLDYNSNLLEIIIADLQKTNSIEGLLEENSIVINLVYSWSSSQEENLNLVNNLINEINRSKIKKIIHCSTAAVVGRTKKIEINELEICNPISEYGRTKLFVENLFLSKVSNSIETIILRPTSVFGLGGAPLKKLAYDLSNGNIFLNYLKSCLFNFRSTNLIPVENLISSMEFFIDDLRNFNKEIFIVSNDNDPKNNFIEVEKLLLKNLGLNNYFLPRLILPLAILSIIMKFLKRNNTNPKAKFVSSKLCSYGFNNIINIEEALIKYANWYKNSFLL